MPPYSKYLNPKKYTKYLWLFVLFLSAHSYAGALPNPRLSPGAIVPTRTAEQLCDKAFRTGTVRLVTLATRKRLFKAYGISWSEHSYYETDHIISLELGGANDPRNLFPEPWHLNVQGVDEGAKAKDILENKLHALVCAHKITLTQAQYEIAHNWVASYKKRVGPLPTYTGLGIIQDLHRHPLSAHAARTVYPGSDKS